MSHLTILSNIFICQNILLFYQMEANLKCLHLYNVWLYVWKVEQHMHEGGLEMNIHDWWADNDPKNLAHICLQ